MPAGGTSGTRTRRPRSSSVGSSMPPELAVDMARAGELLDLGDTIGARRIVRRVLDRAAPELLGELADLATDLGLGEEDLSTAPGRRADVVWRRPPEGSAVRVRARSRRRAWRSSAGRARHLAGRAAGRRPAGPRRRRRGGVLPGHPWGRRRRPGARRAGPRLHHRLRPRRPATGCTRRCAWVATWSAPRPTSAGATGCARTAAPTGSGATRWSCGARPSSPPRCAAVRGPAASCGALWNGADAAGRATVAAWVAAHDAEIPPAPRGR